MVWPLILAAALMAGSTVANNAAANKVAKAQANLSAAQRQRNKRLDDESAALQQQSLGRYGSATEDAAAREASIGDYLAQYGDQVSASAGPIMPASTSNITVAEQGKQQDKAGTFTKQQAGARANLRAFGDTLGDAGRGLAGDMSQLGVLQGFREGDQSVFGQQMTAAQQKGAKTRFLGDLLAAGGQLALSYGLSGGAPGGAPSGSAGTTSFKPTTTRTVGF